MREKSTTRSEKIHIYSFICVKSQHFKHFAFERDRLAQSTNQALAPPGYLTKVNFLFDTSGESSRLPLTLNERQ